MHCNICGSNDIFQKFSLTEFNVHKCKKCDQVFLSQIPSEEILRKRYSSDYYSERKDYYFNNKITNPQHGEWNENIEAFNKGLERLNNFKSEKGRLLDIGCGLGIFLHMAKIEGWVPCGIDISPYAVQYAREKFDLEVYNKGELKEAEFPPNSFDVVTLWDSLEHLPDPLGQLKEIHRILKDDGLIMLNIPNEASLLRIMAKLLYEITKGKLTYPVRKLYHIYHIYYFDPRTVKNLLEKGGFEIVSVEGNTIPLVKARGSSLEKGLVKLLSQLERVLGMKYELLIVARTARNSH